MDLKTEEIEPYEPKFIETCSNSALPFSQADFDKVEKIDELFFSDIKQNYIYEINFSKNSKLEYIDNYSFSSLNLYSINLPGNLLILFPNTLKGCYYLRQVNFIKNSNDENHLEIICDEVFKDAKIESLVIPCNIQEIGSKCFPECFKQIEFENGAPKLLKIGNFCFYKTQIESFNMPLNMFPFLKAKKCFLGCKRLNTINFDCYVSEDTPFKNFAEEEEMEEKEERLNQKNKFKEHIQKVRTHTEKVPENEEEVLNISQDLARSFLLSQINIKKITVLASNLNYFYFFNTPNLISIEIPKSGNAQLIKENGCLYSKDMKKLIVAERNIQSVSINSKCQIIANYALNVKSLEKVEFEKNSELQEISILAFYESRIEDINIPDTVDLIDYAAFYKCEKLKSSNIPKSLFMIDFFTFSYTKLEQILIPRNVIKIKFGCFCNCSNLKNVLFEDDSNLIEIDDYAFACSKIESISIPQNVKRIGNYCFYNCSELKQIEFDKNSSISTIGYKCFDKTQIKNDQLIQILQKVDLTQFKKIPQKYSRGQKIERIIYLNLLNDNITHLSIPTSVEEISFHAFIDCPNLTKVEIADISNSKLQRISSGAFCNCASLTQLEIPTKVSYFGPNCFKNCAKYEVHVNVSSYNIVIGENAFENSGIIEFKSTSKIIKAGDFAFLNCQKLTNVNIKAVNECNLGKYLFLNCNSLNNVDIYSSSKIEIGEGCFMDSSIQKFSIPDTLKVIPKYCFKQCRCLVELLNDESSKIIKFERQAFANSGIQHIYIPSSTKNIGKSCFKKCQQLIELTFSDDLENCIIDKKAFFMSGINYLYIPQGIKRLKSSCFEQCSNLNELIFSDEESIKEIEESVFKCTGIESLNIPSYILLIGNYSFQACKKLKNVTFGNTEIYSTAFYECFNLDKIESELQLEVILKTPNNEFNNDRYIEIPNTEINKSFIKDLLVNNNIIFECLVYINNKIFTKIKGGIKYRFENVHFNNKHLETIEFIDDVYYSNFRKNVVGCDISVESINVRNEALFICPKAFKYSNLKKIDFEVGSKLKSIDKYAFYGLQIEYISIPDSVVRIDDSAFQNCRVLKQVNFTLKSQLKSIGKNAFEKTAIVTILFPSTLESIDEYAFFECSKLRTVHNYSKQIKFGMKSFYHSSIEKIIFPPKAVFSESSFEGCMNLKTIKFSEKPINVLFESYSFGSSGLESIHIEDNNDNIVFHDNVFSYCSNLKNVFINKKNLDCLADCFKYSNIKTAEIKLEKNSIQYFDYIDIINITRSSTISKLDLSIIYPKSLDSDPENKFMRLHLDHNCYVYKNELCYVDFIDNKSLFTNDDNLDESKNDTLIVPSMVKKLNFNTIPFIKKIQWSHNCIVDDLGCPGFFSYYCLVEITIPKFVTKIPPYLFDNCHYLKTVEFENGSQLTEIGECAFSNTRVDQVILPETVRIIRRSAFSYNNDLKEVSFKGEIIENDAFLQTGLIEFNLSDNTKNIQSGAFQFCRLLSRFNIDIEKSNLAEIGPYAFAETSITEINIPQKVDTIHKFTFNGCSLLKEVKISNNSKLSKIDDHSFSGDLSLEKINVPKSVTFLSHEAFINTPSLTSIMTESNEFFDVMKNNEIYSKDHNKLVFVPRNLKQFEINEGCSVIQSGAFCGPNLEEVSFAGNSVICFEKLAFANSKALKKIVIPSSLRAIGNEAFYDCQSLEEVEFAPNCQLKEIPKCCFAFSGLKRIDLPDSIERINGSSFYMCQNLQKVNLSHIRYVGDSAFSETNIKEIKFPPSLQFIDSHAFENTKSLEIADFSQCKNIKNWSISRNLHFHEYKEHIRAYYCGNKNDSDLICYIHESSFCGSNVKTLKFEFPKYRWLQFFDKCTKIEKYIVNENIYLHMNKLPSKSTLRSSYEITKLDWINQDSFIPFRYFNTSKLEKILLTDNIKINNIPNCLFAFSCLEEISIPSSVKSLKSSSFKDCYNLEKVTFSPNCRVKKIERFAFYGCRRLKSFSIPDQVNVISMKSFAFTGLTEVEFPNSIQKVDYMAFYNCKNLSKIIFNEGLKTISDFSFANNYSLETIDLPDSLTTIKSYAFLNCMNLRTVNTKSQAKLDIIDQGAFENTKIEELKLNPEIEFHLKQQNAPYLNNIAFHEGDLMHFRKLDDGTIYDSSGKLIFVPKNLKYLKIDPKCESLEKYVLDGLKNLTTIEFMNEKPIDRSYFIENSSNNVKNIIYSREFVSFKYGGAFEFKLLKSLENLEYKINSIFQCFYDLSSCEKLQKVVLPLKGILIKGAFKNCINLKTVEFIQNIISPSYELCYIDDEAFYNCRSLSSILLPALIDSIGKRAFMNCTNLKHVDFGYKIVLPNKKTKINYYHSSIRCCCIKDEAFKNCTSLESFCIPFMCYKIGSSVFMNCTSLHSIKYYGINTLSIRYRTFKNCTSLTYFHFKVDYDDKSLFAIESESFMNCSALKEIIVEANFLPRNVFDVNTKKLPNYCISSKQKIHRKAFYNCKSLVRARFFIPTLDAIGEKAFMNCSSLKSLEINSGFYSLMLNKNFNLTSFIGVPDDFNIKLFGKQKIVHTFQNVAKKKTNQLEDDDDE